MIGGMLGLIAGGLIGYLRVRFKHACNYVGRDGVADYRCSGAREPLAEARVFQFRDAVKLQCSETERYTNGVYQGTDYDYVWTNSAGRVCFRLKYLYFRSQGVLSPWREATYEFARAAVAAWEEHFRQRQECLSCGASISDGADKCPACGWSYRDGSKSGLDSQEPYAAPDSPATAPSQLIHPPQGIARPPTGTPDQEPSGGTQDIPRCAHCGRFDSELGQRGYCVHCKQDA
jgi:hypothetical protein